MELSNRKDVEGKASFYPNLCGTFLVRPLAESNPAVRYTNDIGAANFERRHFIDLHYLKSLKGGNKILETLTEARPTCERLYGTKREEGEQVLGMLGHRMKVSMQVEKERWRLVKLENVLVVDGLPVPLHISGMRLIKEIKGFNMEMFGSSGQVEATDFPEYYRSHPYWKTPDLHMLGLLGSEANAVSQEIIAKTAPSRERGSAKAACDLCGKASTFHCGRCKAKNYCSKDCQTEHWKVHKKNCQKKKS